MNPSEPDNFRLYFDISASQQPIVYSPKYNITFFGLEKLHPFDSTKWARVCAFLKDADVVKDEELVEPVEACEADLMLVHPARYLNSLKWSASVARITEIPLVALLPNYCVQKYILRPFRYHIAGSVLAGKLAMDRGWAINLGGGFHHCSAERGGGFCVYADITLTVRFALDKIQGVAKVFILDLDAHQGNGHERDFINDPRVYIMDVYNKGIYPRDEYAKKGIKRKIELQFHTEDEEYLRKISNQLELALNEFHPDLLVFNAGTDILVGDPLGLLDISAQGVIRRDELVFQVAKRRSIPILMLTSGGYQRQTASVIANSIINLRKNGFI